MNELQSISARIEKAIAAENLDELAATLMELEAMEDRPGVSEMWHSAVPPHLAAHALLRVTPSGE